MTDAAGNSPLNILVCVKFVPDPNQLQADADGHPDLARAPFRISTFDENAIEAALQLGAKHGGRVFGLSVATGRRPPRDVLLRALAKAAPDRVPAASTGSMNNVALGDDRTDEDLFAALPEQSDIGEV